MRNLSSILPQLNSSSVDLFSLDVEGLVNQTLLGRDFQFHRPKFILAEVRYRNEIDSTLHSQDYQTTGELSYHNIIYRDPKA